jgi:hypothetical protein
VPMQKTYTPIIWAYQNFKSNIKVDELILIDDILKRNEYFDKILDELETKVPEIQDNVLTEIFRRV